MSTIYISEPPTSGKVVINTSCGEIEIELWSKEAPLACRNFIQLCMEGYFNNTIFHRVVKKFIIQGGDPDGTGEGGESIYGKPFKMEVHSRLRFNRRGLVAMHCSNGEVNGSQFFFTLNKTPELQNNYTIFGTVVGNTVFNLLTLAEGVVNKETERPLDPQKIVTVTVITNPFDDIIPRKAPKKEAARREVPAVKDFGLLSFMHDDDDDEEDLQMNFSSKTKSAHDYAKNSNLSNETLQLDPGECIVYRPSDAIDLAPAIITDPSETTEKREEIRKIKLENRKLQEELAKELLKDRNLENDPEKEEVSKQDKDLARNPLDTLRDFSAILKNSKPGDWFYSAVTGAENDELETPRVYDPNVYNPEQYDLHDPRNPLNQRKRNAEEPSGHSKPKKCT